MDPEWIWVSFHIGTDRVIYQRLLEALGAKHRLRVRSEEVSENKLCIVLYFIYVQDNHVNWTRMASEE